jgi:hypothetical protein
VALTQTQAVNVAAKVESRTGTKNAVLVLHTQQRLSLSPFTNQLDELAVELSCAATARRAWNRQLHRLEIRLASAT